MTAGKKEILKHAYAGGDFIIVLTAPSEQKHLSRSDRMQHVDVHVRYHSPIGAFVIRLTLKREQVNAIPSFRDYCAHTCLEEYAKRKGKRIANLTGTN